MPSWRIFKVATMTLNAIHESKILVEISEFTVDLAGLQDLVLITYTLK